MTDRNGQLLHTSYVWAAMFAMSANATSAQVVIVEADGGNRASLGVGDIATLSPVSTDGVAQAKLVERPGYRTPLHVHDATDESFYVLEGVLTFHSDGETRTVKAGDYVFIPRGTPHAQGNQTRADVVLLMTLVLGGFAKFFIERAELVRHTPPDHPDYGARMRELGRRHDIRLIGPAPF